MSSHWKQDFPVPSAEDSYVTRREFTKFLGLTSLAFFIGTCATAGRKLAKKILSKPAPSVAKATPAPDATKGGTQEYTIQLGDTLSRLAQKHYGDALKWPKIFEANKQTVKNPNYIFVGQKIVIPDDASSGA